MSENEYNSILDKLDEITYKNGQLRRANLNKDKTIRHLRRVIRKLKEREAESRKPHYRNSRKKGRNGRDG